MNAIRTNRFTGALETLGRDLATAGPPRAILVVSAHWQTRGTRVVTLEHPGTIHDFGGFPAALYQQRYPAPGSPVVAEELMAMLPEIEGDQAWGLDHGAWSVLRHLFPLAQVPTLQLSLNLNFDLNAHLALARSLRPLRDRGVLIIGSGNVTHNLRLISREEDARPVDWAVEFDAVIADALRHRDVGRLSGGDPASSSLWRRAHPTLEHYLPLLYAVGAATPTDDLTFPVEGFQHGSLSMRTVRFG